VEFELLLKGFKAALQPTNVAMIFLGVTSGMIIGVLPGLTATMAIALLVPFTFGMDIAHGLSMLMGIFCAVIYSGSVPSILIKTPGTPAAAATVLDGYPIAQRGEADRALSISLLASFVGGFTGALIMTFASPQLSKIALKFSAPEYFALAVFGLSIIISISGRSIFKGLMMGLFGLLLCTVGLDPMSGYPRFTFGSMNLFEGPPFIPTLIGLFAMGEVFASVEQIYTRKKVETQIKSVLPRFEDVKACAVTLVKSSGIGSFIGVIPGAGSDIAAFVAYGEAKRSSSHPETFGQGEIRGVAAADSANNACTGGSMIPMLSLGVPGDAVTAVLLGAFIIQGVQPGPLLYRDHIDLVYTIFASMLMANVAMFLVGLVGIRFFIRIISIDRNVLIPIIFILSMVGSFSMRNSVFDMGVTIFFGLVAYFMQKYDYPASPVLLALILGPLAESSLRRSLIVSQGDPTIFFTRPICVTLLALAFLSLATSTIRQIRYEKKQRLLEEQGEGEGKQ
jgi:putative tricarboxylic transport membrane protein